MKLGSTHSHLFQNPQDLDRVAESGKFAFIWMLGLSPQGKCHYDNKIFNYADDASMLETAKRYPGFIYPFRKLDYLDGPDQIDRALEMGYKGFKAISPPLPYDHESYLPLYERMEQYKACIVFHTGHVNTPRYRDRVPGNGYDALHMNPSTLLKLSNFFPDLQPPDVTGVLDTKTQAGLEQIQRAADLPETGDLDTSTWHALNALYRIMVGDGTLKQKE